MMVMSDLLIGRFKTDHDSYLTCYPLPAAARHVLARTWPAGPDYRPGSVWTHSLVIDYPTLAQVDDLTALVSLLRRPVGKLTEFELPLSLSSVDPGAGSQFDLGAAQVAVAGIYSKQAGALICIPDAGDMANEALALALWRQAWPGLRRDFSFVSAATDVAFPLEANCVLKFTSRRRSLPDLDKGLNVLLADLAAPGPTPLRVFLGRYVGEAVEPRCAASEVARIWHECEAAPEHGGTAARAKSARSAGLPKLRRDLVTTELTRAAALNDVVELISEFGDEPLSHFSQPLGRRAADLTIEQIRSLLAVGSGAADGTLGRLALEEVISSVEAKALARAVDGYTRPLLLQARPEIAYAGEFWPGDDAERAELLQNMPARLAGDTTRLLEAIGPQIGPKAARALIDRVLAEKPEAFKDLLVNDNPTIRLPVVEAIAANPGVINRLAATLRADDCASLEIVAEGLIASGIVPDSGTDWLGLLARMKSEWGSRFGLASSLLLVAVALRSGGPSGLDLASVGIDRVLTAAKLHALDWACERWLERALPHGARRWSSWSRLLSATAEVWPPQESDAGSLRLCRDEDNIHDLVSEVHLRYGRNALEVALRDTRLPLAARERIDAKLHPKFRLGLFGLFGV